MKRVAIQGVIGSFHDIAAHQYFEGEQLQIICCSTFEQIFENIRRDPTVIGFLAIENTLRLMYSALPAVSSPDRRHYTTD